MRAAVPTHKAGRQAGCALRCGCLGGACGACGGCGAASPLQPCSARCRASLPLPMITFLLPSAHKEEKDSFTVQNEMEQNLMPSAEVKTKPITRNRSKSARGVQKFVVRKCCGAQTPFGACCSDRGRASGAEGIALSSLGRSGLGFQAFRRPFCRHCPGTPALYTGKQANLLKQNETTEEAETPGPARISNVVRCSQVRF